jgi:hypothetical protein
MFARKLTGRRSNGFERDGGKVAHAVASDVTPCRAKALCGAAPGRLSNGWGLPAASFGRDLHALRCTHEPQPGGRRNRVLAGAVA